MKEARESVWIAVPFAAGVAAARYSSNLLYGNFSVALAALGLSVAGLCAAVAAACRAAGHGAGHGDREVRGMTAAVFLFAGITVCLIAGLAGELAGPNAGSAAGLNAGEAAGHFGAAGAAGGSAGHGGAGPPGSAGRLAYACEIRFREMIDRIPYSNPLSNALVKALLAGDRSSLPWEVRRTFRDAGASHLLALSGMHLGIIYLVFSKTLSLAGNFPAVVKARSALIILGSMFFTLMTGASPSLVRAFLFILIRECAVLLHRRADNINIFCMALVVQLALSPGNVASVGFQLSYLAMLGIFAVYPLLERLWDLAGRWKSPAAGDPARTIKVTDAGSDEGGRGRRFATAMRKLWSLFALSISCQVFTAPATLLYFGTFPRYFLITNLFCMPLTSVAITVSLIVAVLYPLGLCPSFLLGLSDCLFSLLADILKIIAGM